jgi:pilus assembly protein CpaC
MYCQRNPGTIQQILLVIIAALLACAIFSLAGGKAAYAQQVAAPSETLELTVGRSVVLDEPLPVGRISLADPGLADMLLLNPMQVYITGKKPGATNLTLWDKSGRAFKVYNVRVKPELSRLKSMLHQVLPDERNIKVMSAHESITLSGTVSSAENLSTAVELAKLYAPAEDKVVNLMHVGGVHQVMLEVKIAEMSRSVMERVGIDLSAFLDGNFIFTMLNGLFTLDNQGPVSLVSPRIDNPTGAAAAVPGSVNGMFRFNSGKNTFTGFLDVLEQNGLVKILAEPTLVCRSGEEASFLAGGEIPIPVPAALGTVGVDYKPFGVALKFTPRVLSDKRISLEVFPEVSELDFANAVSVGNFSLPATVNRRAQTTVELGDGQSFAIAGLLREQVRENVDKYPVLGDVPVLGMLFRSNEFQKSKTELVIIVTPHLAKPLDMARQSLPTDNYVEPSEFEFFVQGKMEGDPKNQSNVPASPAAVRPPANGSEMGMEGNFGHILTE